MQQSMFSLEEHHASRSQSPDSEKEWKTRVETSPSHILPLLTAIGPSGWFGRTSPAFCRPAKDGSLVPCSEGWHNSGMGSPTGFLTLNTSAWPNAASVCSLSDILEIGDVPRRFYLSAKACAGILRRAEKRGKELPQLLQAALQTVAQRTELDRGQQKTKI